MPQERENCRHRCDALRVPGINTTHASNRARRFVAAAVRGLAILLLVAISTACSLRGALAQTCPGNPDALGTARVLAVSVATTPRVGRKQFPATLPLAPKEVVLTFDDGPWPGTTARVLDALARECVHATFFLLGRNALAAPALARRELADGHTVAHHTFAHPLLSRMSLAAADAEVDRGIAAVERAVYGDAAARDASKPHTPFFRFPGFAASPALLDRMRARGLVVFGADLWASDWNPMNPEQELVLILHRLDAAGRGIILFHDTRAQTAAMIQPFLRALKARGYHVVHVIPAP
jgi:peptidoglycan/xylan/chitin deacetylase (PgdA/CDA1 family)